MPRRFRVFLLFLLLVPIPQWPREDPVVCGTHRERGRIALHLHRESVRARAKAGIRALAAAPTARSIGDIIILEDAGGVVASKNLFDLDTKTVTFEPSAANASKYRFQAAAGGYDLQAAANGVKIEGLADDDTRQITLPFSFPFYGASHQRVYVNSDGNLTFGEPDTASSERSLGRITGGPPRIAPLFQDLDPSKSTGGVRILSAPDRLVVSWAGVPEFRDSGTGPLQTFQVRMYPNGKIEFAYAGISIASAVTAISPGAFQGSTAIVSFDTGSTLEYAGTIAERFGSETEIDVVTAAQAVYQSFEDSYDYLMFFNNLGIRASSSAVAYEMTVRNNRSGYGDQIMDYGEEYGSASRLQAVINLGPLSQYPADPNAKLAGRGQITGDTPLTVMTHEAGHLFLAYASVRDPDNPDSRPMLNDVNFAHWSFFFNSDASVLEGNRIRDDGPGVSPRFRTTATVEGFSELDQYLMGFRAPEEVFFPEHDLFYVSGPSGSFRVPSSFPQVGIAFDGTRRDIAMSELIQVEGRRTPDHTVSQRRFRFAVVLIVPQGTEPSQADLDKVDAFRRGFEAFYRQATSQRAWADTALKRSLKLSAFPAAGVLAGSSMPASITLARPAESAIFVTLETGGSGFAAVQPSVTIPAGATRVTFPVNGIKTGVEELAARPSDPRYETAYARIQVRAARSELKLALVSGGDQGVAPGVPLARPIVLRVVDVNQVPFPGLRVQATVADGGTVQPASATSDVNGLVQFDWTPGTGTNHQLTATVEGAPGSSLAVALPAAPSIFANGVVNAASYRPGLSPGGFGAIFGGGLAAGGQGTSLPPYLQSLAGVQVWLGGRPLPVQYVSDAQINFLAPLDVVPGRYELRVTTPVGSSAAQVVDVLAVSPGIFFSSTSGLGAVVVAGTAQLTDQRPARAGEALEIYATGLGAVQPYLPIPSLQETVAKPRAMLAGTVELPVLFSGLNPVYPGLYQVNVQIPAGVPTGEQTLHLEVSGVQSNAVKIRLQP